MSFSLGRTIGKHPFLSAAGGLGLGGGLGALLGMLGGGGLSSLFGGTAPQQQRTPIFEEDQQSALEQLLQQGLGETDLSGMEQLAQKRFQEETIPSLAERFTAMGSGGQRSSAFQSAIGRAGGDLQAQLAALKPQFGMQKLGMGLQPRYQTTQTEGQPGMLQGLSGSVGKLLPSLLGLL